MGRHRRVGSLERERARRARLVEEVTPDSVEPIGDRRSAARSCAWCGGPIDVKTTGRIPKWCSQSCRQRAWEQKRAAESGLAAVRVVERAISAPASASRTPHHGDWIDLLNALANQLDNGQIYQRELPDLGQALDTVLIAYRRTTHRR